MNKSLFATLVYVICLVSSIGAPKLPPPIPPVKLGQDGRLQYTYNLRGDRIPDYSYCGYLAGEKELPYVPVKAFVKAMDGDATYTIQAAIDYVSSLPIDHNGFRGAVLLDKGKFSVEGTLYIRNSGVVLRGSGRGDEGTSLFGAGYERSALIRILGGDIQKMSEDVSVTDSYVPVNSMAITVNNPALFKVGDQILIKRPSTANWIDTLGCNHFGGGITALGWKPGSRDLIWRRTVVRISNDTIAFDAPLTMPLDPKFGGGSVSRIVQCGQIEKVGVENLACQSAFDSINPKDEDHRWMAVSFENVRDGWVRQVNFTYFAGSAVLLLETATRVTVEDCKSSDPVSEIGGQRRYTFYNCGGQNLFQRCYAEGGYHDFAIGFMAPGPNAFVQCESHLPYSFSGPVDSWASGVLFDVVNVDGNAISYKNRGQDAQGAGWNAAYSMIWQCSASRIDCFAPPLAMNWCFGSWAEFNGDGYWFESNSHINPRSLYYAQLKDRLNTDLGNRSRLMPIETEATSSPTVEVANQLTRESVKPALTLPEWIDQMVIAYPISLDAKGSALFDVPVIPVVVENKAPALNIRNGWLVRGDEVMNGGRYSVPWWSGSARYFRRANASPAITRYVPGREGPGLTDNLQALTDSMVANGVVAIDQNYGLWYDRRRDDHERIRRMDGEVCPPFYELPFARSGQGTAWDGLSKYDLTKYNKWYWRRLKTYADLADEKSLILIHQNYFQHNIIEAGAHYADFPWRTANNINQTGFPEPPPYAGDKRIFMAEQFYDVTHPVRRELHRQYIRQCLNNFKDNSGVIHMISAEFTGPLHFVEFWLDVIAEWQKETGKDPLIALSATKDVQDAILADPVRSEGVDIIDIRYWSFRADGSLYAPLGGVNLAPRQHARLEKTGPRSFEQVYQQIRDYRTRFPEKAVIYSEGQYDMFGGAVLMAGGSLPVLNEKVDKALLRDLSTMHPVDLTGNEQGIHVLANEGKNYLVLNRKGANVKLDLTNYSGGYEISVFDAQFNLLTKRKKGGGQVLTLNKKSKGEEWIWVKKFK